MIFLFFASTIAVAQVSNPEFTAVAKKFESGKFGPALESAESLIDNDKHRKKPEPYLWASMCFYEIYISEDEKLNAVYRSALRNALKHAGKAVSKDKNGNLIANNSEYFVTMKKAGVAYAAEYLADDNARKASYTYKQILKFAPDDQNIRFAKAITDIKLNNTFDAERDINVAFPVLEKNYRDLNYQPDPVSSPLLKDAVIYYIDHLVENSFIDSAKSITLSARVFFPLDEEINKRYKELK
ncbi:MAG: hypothetical protein JKX84_04125 [Flavobacteriales bacterium]|nr:hypothetical protein [Flavobacteriales bacterium]